MKEDLTSIFDANRVQLTKQIDTDGPLLNRLLQDKVLLDEHYEEIKAKETKQRKIETLLDILKRRDDTHYKLFWETLAEYQPALVKECLNPVIGADPGTPTSPLSTSEILRLQRHASNTSKENDSLILENELLKIKKEKSDLELKVQQLEAELTSAREVNEAHEEKEKQMGTDLEMLRRKSAAVFYELQNSRKQCACLTDQVQKMKEDFGQLEVRLCKTEEQKKEADDIINNQTEEMSSMRDNILELEMKLEEYEDTHPKTLDNIHQLGDDVRVEGGSVVMGVTWMDERIYVVCLHKNKIFVFLDQAPFQQQNSAQIELKDMKNPRDIVAIPKDKCLFIGDQCDRDQRLWKIQMPEKTVSKWPINRKPEKLSKTCSDELLVLVSNRLNDDEDEYFIYIYKLDSPTPIRQIILPSDCINEALHAVQISQGMFLISHKVEIMEAGQRRSAWLVSKMNMNGNVVRQFKPALVEAVSLSRPEYFQVGEKGSIIAVDQNNDRVVSINANLTCGQVLIRHDSQHTTFKKPFRICHLTDKNIYIVGHWTQRGGTFSVYGQQN